MELKATEAVEVDQDAPLKVRQRASRAEVLDAAAEAFMERGYAATSIDDVANRMGCTKGRVYHYFQSKGGLFLGVHRRALDMAIEAVQPVSMSGGSARERLYLMAAAHARLMMEETSYMRLAVQHVEMSLTVEGRTSRQDLLDVFALRHEYEAYFETVIAEGVKSGEFREVNPGLMAKACMGTLNWMTVWYRPGGTAGLALEEIAAEFATFVTRGLEAGGGVAARPDKKVGSKPAIRKTAG
ncbi:MAG TPA: TetR/AcrR family transcriptional regulator [Jatrophihabitantaceae bacterium]|nr:TetR/AcrR family transcriptional regulator [Jatrophihabitantaceae bacterium]